MDDRNSPSLNTIVSRLPVSIPVVIHNFPEPYPGVSLLHAHRPHHAQRRRIHFIQTHVSVWISPGVLRVSGDILRGANRIEDLLLRWQRCGKRKGSDQNQRDLPQPLGPKWTEHSYPFGWHVGRGRVMLRHLAALSASTW